MFRDSTRFSQFQGSLGIAPNILSRRLTALVDAGILRVADNRGEYLLTEMGQALKPVIVALTRWGDRWISAGPARFVHGDCETDVEHHFWCDSCVGKVDPVDVQVRPRRPEHRDLDAWRTRPAPGVWQPHGVPPGSSKARLGRPGEV